MDEFWIIILVLFCATNSLDKAESVKVKLELKTFDEIFGEGWWDKDEAEDLKTPAPTNFGQNVHHQIDRQNTQIGQIVPNSSDQNAPPNENIAEDERKRKIINKFHSMKNEFNQKEKYSKKEKNQIEEKIAKHLKVNRKKIYDWKKELGLSQKVFYEKEKRKHLVKKFDQIKAELMRAGLKNSYSNQIDKTVAKELGLSFRTIYNWKRKLGQTMTNYSDDEKFEIVKKFMRMKNERFGEDKKSYKEIGKEISERFGVNVCTINQWKKEFGLSKKVSYKKNERKNLVEKFDQRKAELKRDGFKNSYKNQIDETVAKELGITDRTISNWKRELGLTEPQHKHSHNEQKKLMKLYYQIKDQNPKISDRDITKRLNISRVTLSKWKKQFKRQQFYPNFVDGHSVEENSGANVQEIENINSGSI